MTDFVTRTGKKICIWGVCADTWRGDSFEDLDVYGGKVKMSLKEIGWVDKVWIDLAQDRDRWRAVMNTVMNCRVL